MSLGQLLENHSTSAPLSWPGSSDGRITSDAAAGPHAKQCTFVHIIYSDSDNMILPNIGTDYADIWEQRRFCWNSGTNVYVWLRIFDTWVKMGKSVITRWGVDKIKIGQKSYLYLRGQQETGSGQAMDMNSFFVFMYILY